MLSHFSPLCSQLTKGSCKDCWDAGLGWGGKGGEQTPAQRSCRTTGGIAPKTFHHPSFPHTRSASPVLALLMHKMWDSVMSIPGYGWDGACYGTGCPHPCSLSELQARTYLSNPRWHEQTLPRFVQQIFGKEKVALPPSLPPSLPRCSRVSAGTRWQKAVAFPKSSRKTWNPRRPAGRSLPRVCLLHSCKVKVMSLPDSFALIKGLVIPHLPIQVYPYTHLLGYFIHKALNETPFFFFSYFWMDAENHSVKTETNAPLNPSQWTICFFNAAFK